MIDHEAVILDLETKRDAINNVIAMLRQLYGMPASNGHQAPPPTSPVKKNYKAPPHNRLLHKADSSDVAEAMVVDPNTGRQSPLQDAIRQVLKAGPLTSIETFEAVEKTGYRTTAGSIYGTLRLMFGKGLVTKNQNDFGQVAWKLVP